MKRYVGGTSVIGATHKRNSMPLQDSNRIEYLSDDVVVIAVADGHGSEKCKRSDRGSAIAVNTFCSVIKKYVESYGPTSEGIDNLITFLNREGETHFAQDICEEWQRRVKQSFNKNKDESLIDENSNVRWKEVYSLYGTTLLGMLITNSFVFTFQIGDGDINFVTKDEVHPMVEPEKFLGTETHSLSKIDAWKKAVSSVRRKDASEGLPYMYMLSTDGFVNSYASSKEYIKTCKDYLEMIEEHGFDAVESNLTSWLEETSELGCGDDITVVMAYHQE